MPQIRKHVTIDGRPFRLIDTVDGAEGIKHLLYRSEYGGYLVSFTDRYAKVLGVDDGDRRWNQKCRAGLIFSGFALIEDRRR